NAARLNIRWADTTGPVVRDAFAGAARFAEVALLADFFFVAFFFSVFFGDFLLVFFTDFLTDFFFDNFFFAAMVLCSLPDDYGCSHP
ncbi:MAG: hypothetical protein ACO21F_02480, partial [Ilumatobacteraceae bacterium]